jgi:uncharacterized lipoprotein YmbA
MKKLIFIGLLVILLGSCSTTKNSTNRVVLPKENYENDIKTLETAMKVEKSEIKLHEKNVAKYKEEIKLLKNLVKSVK